MKSDTASLRQPKASGRLFTFDEFADGKGISARVMLRDFAKYYAEDSRQEGQYEDDWDTSWGHKNKWIDKKIHNADDAMDAIRDFRFPHELRIESEKAAADLTNIFQEVAVSVRVRHQLVGRLDPMKLPALAEGYARGHYAVEEALPYVRRELLPAKTPVIAILASGANVEMWGDPDYIPRVSAIATGLLWACEAAGIQTYTALVMEHCRLRGRGKKYSPYDFGVYGMMVATPFETTPLSAYGVAFHRDVWRYGHMTAQMADYESNKRFMEMQGKTTDDSCGYYWPSRTGGRAVQWAKEVLLADLVIAIGGIDDEKDADIRLPTKFKFADAVKSVAEQAVKLKGR